MTTDANTLKVYEILKETFGKAKASTVIDYLENSTSEMIENKVASKVEHLATKSDIEDVKGGVGGIKVELHKVKADLMRWMFIFWTGNVAVILGIVYTILKVAKLV